MLPKIIVIVHHSNNSKERNKLNLYESSQLRYVLVQQTGILRFLGLLKNPQFQTNYLVTMCFVSFYPTTYETTLSNAVYTYRTGAVSSLRAYHSSGKGS